MNRLLIGTIIGNYYKGARPWYLNTLELAETTETYAEQLLKKYPNEWANDSFKSWYPSEQLSNGFFTRNRGTIKPYALKPGQIKSATEGQKVWDSAETIKIQQAKGVNTAKVSVVGIVGSTKWKINIRCGEYINSGAVTSAVGQKTSGTTKYY